MFFAWWKVSPGHSILNHKSRVILPHFDCFTNNGILTGRRQNCLVVRDVGLAGHFCWSPAKTKGVSLGNCLTLPGFPFLSFLVVSKKTC